MGGIRVSRAQTILFALNLLLFMAIKAVKIGFSNLLPFYGLI